MKLVKNGKLFGKVNLFDVAVILMILFLVIAGFTKFKTFNKAVDGGSMGKVIYTFIINDVRNYTSKAFASGDSVFDTMTDINIGKIINVETRDARIVKGLATGKSIVTENPYKNDIILTIEAPGSVTDSAYFANKSVELKVGSEKKIETLYATVSGKIGSIVYTDEK